MKLRGRSHTKLVTKRNSMISVGFERVRKKSVSDLWQTHLLWLFERRRYFHLHSHQCGITALPRCCPFLPLLWVWVSLEIRFIRFPDKTETYPSRNINTLTWNGTLPLVLYGRASGVRFYSEPDNHESLGACPLGGKEMWGFHNLKDVLEVIIIPLLLFAFGAWLPRL